MSLEVITSIFPGEQMKKENVEHTLAKFNGSEASTPFGPEALVFKVCGKMFALVSQGEEIARLTVKCDPADASQLVSHYSSIVPGYYMNKKHWITISLTGEVPEPLLSTLMAGSYKLVVSKLPKKEREALRQG